MRRWAILGLVGLIAGIAMAAGSVLIAGRAPDFGGLLDIADGARTRIPAPSEGRTAPKISPPDPVAGEVIRISGELTTSLSRPVILEARDGTEWRTVEEGETTSQGHFSFSLPAPGTSTTYRGRAPVFTIEQGGEKVSHARQTTRRKTVRPVKATAALAFAPAPVGQSEDGEAVTPGEARFVPARPGREVVLQRRATDRWEDVMTSAQDERGIAAFGLDLGDAHGTGSYRAVTVAAAGAPKVTSAAVDVLDAPLTWSAEFNGTQLDFTKWDYRQLGDRNPDGSRACAESDTASVSVAGGHARFSVHEIPPGDANYDEEADCPHGQFYNGHIGTSGKFAFRYGVVAARMRFPDGQGQHSAFWSQPAGGSTGAEIDAVEYFGDGFPAKPDTERGVPARSHAVQHSIYWTKPDGSQGKVGGLFDLRHLLDDDPDWSDGFHVYSVEWTPEEYIFRVDGHETFRTSQGLSDVEQYLILSLLTSDWELPRFDTSEKDPLRVDWVRVWQPAG